MVFAFSSSFTCTCIGTHTVVLRYLTYAVNVIIHEWSHCIIMEWHSIALCYRRCFVCFELRNIQKQNLSLVSIIVMDFCIAANSSDLACRHQTQKTPWALPLTSILGCVAALNLDNAQITFYSAGTCYIYNNEDGSCPANQNSPYSVYVSNDDIPRFVVGNQYCGAISDVTVTE